MDITHLKYLGITAPHEILFILPEDYRDLRHPTRTFSELIPNSRVLIEGTVTLAPAESMGPGASMLAELSDQDGARCQIFLQGAYQDIKDILLLDARCYVYGHVNAIGEGYVLQQAALVDSADIGHINPVYPCFSHTLRGSEVRDLIRTSFDTTITEAVTVLRQLCAVDTVAEQRQFLARYGSRFDAFASLLKNLHYPGSPGAGFQAARVIKLIHAATVYRTAVIEKLSPVPAGLAMPEVTYCPYTDADYRDSGEIDSAYGTIRDEIDQQPPLRRVLSAEATTEHLALIERIIELYTANDSRVCVQIAAGITDRLKQTIVSAIGHCYSAQALYESDAHLYIVYTDHHYGAIKQPPLDRHALIIDMGTPTRAITSYVYPGFTYTRLTQTPVTQPPVIRITKTSFIHDVISRLATPSIQSMKHLCYLVSEHDSDAARQLIASIQEQVAAEGLKQTQDFILKWPVDEGEVHIRTNTIVVIPCAEQLSMFDLYTIKQWVARGHRQCEIELLMDDAAPESARVQLETLRAMTSGHQAIYQDVADTTYPPYTNSMATKLLVGVNVTHADIESLLTQCRDPRIYLGKPSIE